MRPNEFASIAFRLLRHPTAPYHEHAVRAEVEQICRENQIPFHRDPCGNVVAKYSGSRTMRPLALAAHMDHPGFEILRRLSSTRFVVRFLGGVPRNYFRPGIRLRLMPDSVPAQLGRPVGKALDFEVTTSEPVSAQPEFAVWDLEDYEFRRDIIHARACDDLIGVAAILATLIELKRSGARANVLGLFSRAEEIGFRGAMALAVSPLCPRGSLVVSLETSKELPGVRQGAGVILRVGDRTSIFDSEATRFLAEVGAELGAGRSRFQMQRALMSGGTCEATAYQEFGFQTAAVCIALGNYHNCAPGGHIKTENVHVGDACAMVELLVAAAQSVNRYRRLVGKLHARLIAWLSESENRLRKTA